MISNLKGATHKFYLMFIINIKFYQFIIKFCFTIAQHTIRRGAHIEIFIYLTAYISLKDTFF